MDLFNHVQKVYTETDIDALKLDIPLAIFMIKLLSIKVDFSNFFTWEFFFRLSSDNFL